MNIDKNALDKTLVALKEHLLRSRVPQGSWQGKLSSSALSTATAVFALATVDKKKYKSLIFKGLDWLKDNCNADGGWGDTPHQLHPASITESRFSCFETRNEIRQRQTRLEVEKQASPSNISTTLLCWSAFAIADGPHRYDETVAKAESWLINFAGSLEPKTLARAINQQYGQDRSFSAPILTMCTLAGRLGESKQAWRWIKPLPFELATCPHWLFKWLKLPVVSYALPALIAVGQANYYHRRPKNPVVKLLRYLTRRKTLTVLRNIQPESGGFLEAIPLTAFVVMSLAASGQRDNDVTVKGTEFLIASVREDGSWPIDTNLATWVTTLSINALAAGQNLENALSLDERANLQQWLLSLQYCQEHPYTHAAGGGWAWTNLPGAVPDADDTAGALIALRHLGLIDKHVIDAVMAGLDWLLGLQNRDGGIPTFCRGWTALPFDRSAPDLTAHTIGAISAWLDVVPSSMHKRMVKAITSGLTYLKRVQNQDGSWVPLWFGNQFAPNQENPLYGTARVLTALCGSTTGGFNPAINCVTEPPVKLGAKYSIHLAPRFTWGPCFTRVSRFTRGYAPMINKAVRWLLSAQNQDGGWGRAKSTIEETALAVDALAELMLCGSLKRSLGMDYFRSAISRGVSWLIEQTKQGTSVTASPIGLYFARLWYFEELYPVIFTVSALQKVQSILATDFTDFTEIHNKNY